MPPVKYLDFEVSSVFTRPSKKCDDKDAEREYVSITCPHCNSKFTEVTSETIGKMKATKCKAHLEVCPEFKAKGGSVEPAPTRESALSKQLAEMEARLKEQIEKSISTSISRAMGLGEPDAQTENELVARGKRKIEEANVFSTIAKNDDAIQQFRKMFHPDKKASRSPEVNAVCDVLMGQLLEAQKYKK